MNERVTEVNIGTHVVTPGMEVTLSATPGRRKGRYRFEWAEMDKQGRMILSVYGPLRSRANNPHYRLANVNAVQTVHVKTKE